MTKTKTVETVERATLYSRWNSLIWLYTCSLIENKQGGNTFICDKKRQTRLK